MGASAFGLDAEAVGLGVDGEDVVVLGDDEVGDGSAEIGKETGALVAAADDAACYHGEPGNGVVAAELLELLTEVGGPVGAA